MSYPIASRGFLRCYWVHMRPYLLFLSGIAALAGMAQVPGPLGTRVLVAMIPFFLSYGIGQALTDAFQVDTDSISSPYRPLVRGEITRGAVIRVSLAGLGAGVVILAALNPWILLPGILSIVGLATYTPFKRRWWGGPPWNAWIVALLPVMGRMIEPGFRPWAGGVLLPGVPASFWCVVVAVFFGYANFVLGGYFKDISADRATGYDTIPVRFGWKAGVLGSDLLALCAAIFTVCMVLPSLREPTAGTWIAGVSTLAGFGVTLAAQSGLHRTRDENATHGPICHIVRAFILFGIAMTLAGRPGWWPALLVYYGLFELTLRARPEERQV